MPVRRDRWVTFSIWTHGLAALALAVSAVALWRTYCESFGCIGVGIAWAAWVAAYVGALLVGLLALRGTRPSAPPLLRAALAMQLVGGACLFAYWAMRSFA